MKSYFANRFQMEHFIIWYCVTEIHNIEKAHENKLNILSYEMLEW